MSSVVSSEKLLYITHFFKHVLHIINIRSIYMVVVDFIKL